MFNLSLSSKELFHSNLLAWLAEDSDTRDLFVEVLKLFGLEPKQAEKLADGIRGNEYMVLREYKNFDFCICEKLKNWKEDSEEEYVPGRVVLVLENKFKSIPYEKQLKEYIEKVIKLNGEERDKDRIKEAKAKCNIKPKCKAEYLPYMDYSNMKCHFVLLTLNKDICGLPLDDQKKSFCTPKLPIWHVVSYKEYAEVLRKDKTISNFKHKIICDYAGYVDKFCEYVAKNLEVKTDEPWNKVLCPNKELLSIRMDDIWQKLVANIVLKHLRAKGVNKGLVGGDSEYVVGLKAGDFLKKGKTGQVFVGAGFSRGTALIEIKIHIENECLFGVQIQNGLYKRFLEASKGEVEKDEKTRITFYKDRLKEIKDLNLFRYNNSNWEDAVDKVLTGNVSPKDGNTGKAGLQGFGGYGTTFLAQWKAIDDGATVEKVIEHIIADCKKVKKHPNL